MPRLRATARRGCGTEHDERGTHAVLSEARKMIVLEQAGF